MNAEKLKRMQAQVRTGGPGTARRKKKIVRKNRSADDARLQQSLKKLGLTPLPAIDEVNLFKEDGTVIHITNPKIQANPGSNTYVVSGNTVKKPLTELLPGILTQLGRDSLQHLRQTSLGKTDGAAAAAAPSAETEEVPELVGTFDS